MIPVVDYLIGFSVVRVRERSWGADISRTQLRWILTWSNWRSRHSNSASEQLFCWHLGLGRALGSVGRRSLLKDLMTRRGEQAAATLPRPLSRRRSLLD